MTEKDEIFSEEYITVQESTGVTKIIKKTLIEEELEEIKIDEDQYGMSKPRRVIIRAKEIND